jgi:hypothetical protein
MARARVRKARATITRGSDSQYRKRYAPNPVSDAKYHEINHTAAARPTAKALFIRWIVAGARLGRVSTAPRVLRRDAEDGPQRKVATSLGRRRTVTVPRRRAVERQRIETPGGRVILGTFGPEGTNGWDLWVPAVCGIVKFTRGKTGTLIRLVPDSALE